VSRLLLVYGTLKRGERNHARMDGARLIGPATTREAAYTLAERGSVSAPGRTVPDVAPGGIHRISGELYEVDAPLLAALDLFERVGTDYRRSRVVLEDGRLAEIYLRAIESTRPALSPVHVRIDGDVVSWSEAITS
jgi:gamma-glutamylaminecyclotransferase